jgi:surfactin synthase thioesterase subunit
MQEKTQLICFPYAGGNSSFYRSFNPYLNKNIDLIAIDIKGHGRRFNESCNYSMKEIVSDAVSEIEKQIGIGQYALFGYSMGATICYESYGQLYTRTGRKPKHVFLAASTPPHIKDLEADLHLWSNEKLIKRIAELGGIPEEVLNERELLEMVLHVLRADVQAENEYVCEFPYRMDSDISVIYSPQDTDDGMVAEWNRYTSRKCNFYEFNGDHFFINNHLEEVVSIINNTLIK